eukprot:CAMPEP_0175265338 /NCGR_PEP_ID=MMETSP0093-20121207/42771_1 /TAXON_ID=311494 /ORGANISM="Alexandrium monilatum, Strain CCMP3105" /LENGTH=98 /DNA_ID=CAMNT_0016559919 /DNA_START=61 /DNA_END=353 /DNA_ORIENTATION=-
MRRRFRAGSQYAPRGTFSREGRDSRVAAERPRGPTRRLCAGSRGARAHGGGWPFLASTVGPEQPSLARTPARCLCGGSRLVQRGVFLCEDDAFRVVVS